MAQFDIYENPRLEARRTVPYVVDVQSGLLDHLSTRLVVPVFRVGARQAPGNLCPTVEMDGETLSLMPHLAAPLSARLLKQPVASLAPRAGEVAAAFDAVLSGF
ncbi:toxin CcdB [Variovorax boronicumulans]|uniref:CcdB family protein n=1 Tax=Variovorax TaxID=34072 RepID=UPI00277F9983|nr:MULTISPECIES: CcdB family protein [Variovorax]MDQ0033512.1 toxin CcdB [Variovorax boronicumulans]MDQ0606485.1 toxin CcdB [Variovorax sp. W1I1]